MTSHSVVLGLLAFMLFATGCSTDTPASNDLSADLSSADLTSGGFCDGTPLAGTCAPAFMAPLEACYKPVGACKIAGGLTAPGSTETVCWENGSRLVITLTSDGGLSAEASRDGTACYSVTSPSEYGSLSLTPAGGSATLTYDNGTGVLTCPDHSTVSVGSPYGMCPLFKDYLDGPDFSGCLRGSCP